ncbi:glycoside hydrolase family 2 protein [Saccharicrinis aurantiacus]|uniref:glycoside hydrolase family 2 protein n=1 Tax=Saccharicrinis aurantiacus TaxID=1849719 RepID=UPI000839A25F|nr:sugar-binding domain-containing protein [Saccharicrinis aurantiacus]
MKYKIKSYISYIMSLLAVLLIFQPTLAQKDKDIANDYFRQDEQSDYGTQNDNPLTYDLSGHLWKIQGALPGRGLEEKFPEISYDHMGDALNWAPAHVPGDVFTDLWRIGRIDDPHFGRNSTRAKWVNEYEWWYLRTFNVPKEMKGKKVEITIEGVDYAYDVFLNGELLGSHEGMFTSASFDITHLISFEHKRRGRNVLTIRLHPAPRRYSQVAGRKPAWHGDYWVDLVPTGIWKPVKLEAYEDAKVKDIYVQTKLGKKSSADLDIQLEVENPGKTEKIVDIEIDIQGENFKSKSYTATIKQKLAPGINEIKTSIRVPDAKLWYPWDLGDQNLYLAKVSLKGSKDKILHADSKLFGIREIEMTMNPGYTKDEVENPWTVMINGKRHFMRSGTWGGPPDIFFGRASNEKYEEFVRLAKAGNMNNLRIFGWHPTEIPYFYELCNREGITVWQDILPIASLSLPKSEEFKEAIFSEAISVVKDLRNNPCMVILEGGEEILMTASDPVHNLNLMKELGEVVRPYSNLHYVPVSPLSDHIGKKLGFKSKESIHANGLFYSEGRRNTEQFFNGQDYAAVAELAISSCPNVESIKKFIPEDELWPPGPSWGHHWTDFDTFRTLNFEIVGSQATGSMQEFVDATQIAQGVIFQYGIEYYRRRKPKSSAICICHYITFAPDMKWGIVDYYQQPKISYNYVKNAFQPLLVSLQHDRRRWLPGEQFEGKIWVVNDFYKEVKGCTVDVVFLDDKKKEVSRESIKLGNIGPDSSKDYATVNCKVPGNLGDQFHVELEMRDKSGEVVSVNDYLLLVGDEKVDLPRLREIGQEAIDKKEKYGPHNYFRYFEGLNGSRGVKQAEELMPRVKEFVK